MRSGRGLLDSLAARGVVTEDQRVKCLEYLRRGYRLVCFEGQSVVESRLKRDLLVEFSQGDVVVWLSKEDYWLLLWPAGVATPIRGRNMV